MAQVSNLVSFVKSLLENDNTVIKEENKRRLEAQYNQNGTTLNKNLADKYEQVSQILSVYKYISERVKSNRAGVLVIKNNLNQCKQLLQCNRDDLRRLWLELIEKRNCVMLLDALEEVRLAPELVTTLTEAKRWSDATVTVLTAQKKLDSELQNVVGILSVRTDLSSRQKILIDRLKSELHKLTFIDVMNFALKNLNSFGDRRASERSIGKKINIPINHKEDHNESDTITLSPPFSTLSLSDWRSINIDNEFLNGKLDNFDIKTVSQHLMIEDKSKSEESQQAQNLISVIYSLNQFNKFQELLNEWSVSGSLSSQAFDESGSINGDHIRFIRKEIYKLIIIKSIEHIKRSAMSQNDSRLDNFEDCRYLLELLDLLYVTLFQCQSALLLIHRIISNLIKSRKHNIIMSKYEELHIYFDETSIRNIIQNELKSLLSIHLKLSDKDRLLNRSTNKFDNEFHIPNKEVLKLYMGKKKGLLGSVSVIQSNIPVGGHSGVPNYYGSDSSNNSKQPLFKFSHSSHALSVTACLQEMRPLNINIDNVDKSASTNINNEVIYPPVCKPHHNNITSIYGSIMEFIETLEAEEYLNKPINTPKKPCILREYIHSFIEEVFLSESKREMNSRLNKTFEDHDTIKGLQNLVSQASERELGLQRPIIAVMLTADQCLEEIKRITIAINHYSIKCLKNGFEVMKEFNKNLWLWFKDLSALDDYKEAHMSTEWGKDEDLIRFWKAFPSWQKMMNIDSRENFNSVDHADVNLALNTSLSASEGFYSPGADFSNKQFKILSGVISNDTTNDTLLEEREARLRINQESDHLLQLIKEELKSQSLVTKTNLEFIKFTVFFKNDLIKHMARLHESVAWFSQRTYRFQSWLNGKSFLKSNNQKEIVLSDKQKEELNRVIKDFSNLHNSFNNLADACLMSIHLEGRLRAYNFITLIPLDKQYGTQLDEIDIDPQITALVKSLTELEFALTHALTRHKFRFVFEGLGNFVSALFVQILPKIRQITTSGIKKMCRNIYLIQQTLSVLTQTHEMDLVRVKQLYELLHVSPEAVVNRILEQGAVYDEAVYKSVLLLYQQSHTLYDHEKLQVILNRLSEVINMEYV